MAAPVISPNSSNGAKRSMFSKRVKPKAAVAAFSGPPRYDWIDIETAAAIKLQAVFRRRMVEKELVSKGIKPPSYSRREKREKELHDDMPKFLRMCGLGLIFGGLSREEKLAERRDKERDERQKRLDMEKKQEEKKRQYHKKKIAQQLLLEEVEVVEDISKKGKKYTRNNSMGSNHMRSSSSADKHATYEC
mmetsp:Transcript_663/g.1529  ORF Transcript_663/g.1529 Transcript_663/m.1529 type:complete len:191 (-) Transcript_663:169-741(-)